MPIDGKRQYRAWTKVGAQISSVRVKAKNKTEAKEILQEAYPTVKIGHIEKIKA